MEFRKYKIMDLYNVSSGLSKKKEEFGHGYPFLTFKNVFYNTFLPDVLTEKANTTIQEREKASIRRGDVFLTRTSEKFNELGKSSVALTDYAEATFNGFTKRLRPKNNCNNILLPEYAGYFFRAHFFSDQILRMSTMSTRASLNNEMISKLYISIPSIENQIKISNILLNFDNKIEINNKVINNLEQISQTLFKRWFIDFEFPNEEGQPYKSSGGKMIESELGEIPEGWEVRSLNQELDLIKGLSYKGKFLDKNKNLEESFPLISLSNFQFIKGFKDEKTKYYFGEHKEHHLVHEDDIVIAATDLTQDRKMLGAPALVPDLNRKMIFSLDVFKVTDSMLPKNFLYYLLQTQRYRNIVEGSATGTTVLRISKNALLSFSFTKSYFDLESKFNDIVQPNFDKIKNLNIENKNLEQLRDTLLPKLLSVEIEIPDDLEV